MKRKERAIIAVDGYSSCGKSTFAKAIARELNYIYIDSGAMYRAVTLFALRKGFVSGGVADTTKIISSLPEIKITFRLNGDTGFNETLLNGESVERELRDRAVSDNVSAVSTIAEVREKMVELQREMGARGGIVMDGRDIGTVVFPDAQIKIFMTATPAVRAQRRYLELLEKGMQADLTTVANNINDRDRIDSSREISPLRQAGDAVVLDNSEMTPEEQMVWFIKLFNERMNEN
ncbi:MAG: (d)CMP kinase [Bacteroidales bacterium]|jgi:cytidylate kinase|nr:(d)CMP kinase [Bacteroidales bacterium]